jgi:hypothetical protein
MSQSRANAPHAPAANRLHFVLEVGLRNKLQIGMLPKQDALSKTISFLLHNHTVTCSMWVYYEVHAESDKEVDSGVV